ncbi:MAG: ISAs1 family transposase, partial [Bacilli bacterium]|nr:ISAs1 family transposase [Bacilli bacterium]
TTQIDDKTNEIPTIENLVKDLNLKGIIVTWDALNTQTKNIEAVIGADGDYVVPIKGNQGTFYQDLIDYFDEKKCEQIIAGNNQSEYLMYIEKSHSSIIKYECFQTSDVNWYSKKVDWKKLNSIGMVRKTITQKSVVYNEDKKGKKKKTEKIITTVEKKFYISSRFPNIKEFNEATREHWSVENKIHWHLDFTFCQDNNTTTNKKALLNLEIIHKFVLAILERVKLEYSMSLRSIRKHLSNNFKEFFPKLLCYLVLQG